MGELVTVWITKWALTKGIVEAKGCEISEGYASRKARFCTSPDYVFARMGQDAFLTEEEAIGDTLDRIQRRLKALDKEKTKLEALRKTLV